VVPSTKRTTKNFAAHGTLVVGKESVYAGKGDDFVTWVGKATLAIAACEFKKTMLAA